MSIPWRAVFSCGTHLAKAQDCVYIPDTKIQPFFTDKVFPAKEWQHERMTDDNKV
jgi:hypothetical protein